MCCGFDMTIASATVVPACRSCAERLAIEAKLACAMVTEWPVQKICMEYCERFFNLLKVGLDTPMSSSHRMSSAMSCAVAVAVPLAVLTSNIFARCWTLARNSSGQWTCASSKQSKPHVVCDTEVELPLREGVELQGIEAEVAATACMKAACADNTDARRPDGHWSVADTSRCAIAMKRRGVKRQRLLVLPNSTCAYAARAELLVARTRPQLV